MFDYDVSTLKDFTFSSIYDVFALIAQNYPVRSRYDIESFEYKSDYLAEGKSYKIVPKSFFEKYQKEYEDEKEKFFKDYYGTQGASAIYSPCDILTIKYNKLLNNRKEIIETKGIIRNSQGTIDCETEESKDIIQENNRVSMNMWAGYPCFIDYLENGFKEFLLDDSGDPLTKEYLLPIIVDQLIKTNRASVKVLETTDKWFGVTYPEDKQIVQDSINELIEQGTYPEKLWK